MSSVVPLAEADDEALFGAKAVGLGDAIRAGLPVPPGVALSGDAVEAIASGEESAVKALAKSVRGLAGPLAVRSSCVDEDGAEASFAGQHLTLLNVLATGDLQQAVREVWWSANSDSAITYRQRVGLFARPSVGVVVQSLLDPESAGVMFTTNPVTGADERMIEASWGSGEAVVAGRVIPDQYRIDPPGTVLERIAGVKQHRDPDAARRWHRRRAGRARRSSSGSASTTRQLADAERAGGAVRAASTARPATSSGRSPTGGSTCCSAERSRGRASTPRDEAPAAQDGACVDGDICRRSRCSPT